MAVPSAATAWERMSVARQRSQGQLLASLIVGAVCSSLALVAVFPNAFAVPVDGSVRRLRGLSPVAVPLHQPQLRIQEEPALSPPASIRSQGGMWVGLVPAAALLSLIGAEGVVASRGTRVISRQAPVSTAGHTVGAAALPSTVDASPKTWGAGLLAFGFFVWYASNVSFNIVNKQALGLFPHAWSVSVVQLATVVLCSAAGWATGQIPSPLKDMGPGFLMRLLPAAVCHALGNGLTSVAFSCGSVSFTHVIKTSEPVWMALGNLLITGTVLPWKQALALLPVMLGVALASAGEMAFTWVGFLAALGSTICFAGRGIFSKRLMGGTEPGAKKMSPLNVYALDSLMALAFTLPVALLADGPTLLSGGQLATLLTASQGAHILGLLAATGLSYYAYNAIAFKLLGRLDVVSHAVGNLGKRIFVIGFSVLAFNTPLSTRAAVGSFMAIAGSGLYSYVKTCAGRKKEVPAAPAVQPHSGVEQDLQIAAPAAPEAVMPRRSRRLRLNYLQALVRVQDAKQAQAL